MELQDAEVTETQQRAFKELCDEFKDIFSTDSSDKGKTPLIEMEMILVIVHLSLRNPIFFL